MLYSGAIDDRHVRLGQKKEAAERQFLEDAIKAAIDGKPVAVPKTTPVGCLLEDPPNKTVAAALPLPAISLRSFRRTALPAIVRAKRGLSRC